MLLFIPGRLTDGIEFSDDPLLPERDGSYRVSFERRSVDAHCRCTSSRDEYDQPLARRDMLCSRIAIAPNFARLAGAANAAAPVRNVHV